MCGEAEVRSESDGPCSTAVLDIGGETGALVIFSDPQMSGREIEICPKGDLPRRSHNVVRARQAPSGIVHAAVFPALSEGIYTVLSECGTPICDAGIVGGTVTEIDVRGGAIR